MSRRRRSRRPVRRELSVPARAAMGLGVAAALLLMAEGVARVVGPQIPEWQGGDQGSVVMGGHPTRLWGMNTGHRQVGTVAAFINERGLRGELPTLPRPEGRQRIMLVGDSTFFGHGIEDDQTILAQTVARLSRAGLDVDGVNGGIPGYSSEQTRLLMEEDGWDLEPTLLLIGNLWSDNNFDHFRDADLLRTRRMWMENPLSRSSLYLVLSALVDQATGDPQARIVTWTRTSELPDYGIRRVPLQRYAHNLDTMVRDAHARGIQAALVSPVNRQMAEQEVGLDVAWGPYFDAQAAVAAHHGIPRIELAPALVAAARIHDGEDLFLDEMHPTPLGAGYFADALVAGLRGAGWPEVDLTGTAVPFDSSGLRDVIEGGVSLTVNELSPQANLYPGIVPPKRVAPADPTRSYEPVYWSVAGTVRGPPGAVRLTVTTDTGDVVSSAELRQPGDFSFTMSLRVAEVVVRAETADGGVVSATCAQGCDPIELVVPGAPPPP